MSRRLCWSLLAASVALNICFIGGVFYFKSTKGWTAVERQIRVKAAIAALGLEAHQVVALEGMRTRVAGMRKDLDAVSSAVRGGFLQELVRPELSEAEIAALLQKRNEMRQPHLVAISVELHAFLQELTPEQRQEFIALAGERGFMRRFMTAGE